jgi:hypothetical protein
MAPGSNATNRAPLPLKSGQRWQKQPNCKATPQPFPACLGPSTNATIRWKMSFEVTWASARFDNYQIARFPEFSNSRQFLNSPNAKFVQIPKSSVFRVRFRASSGQLNGQAVLSSVCGKGTPGKQRINICHNGSSCHHDGLCVEKGRTVPCCVRNLV